MPFGLEGHTLAQTEFEHGRVSPHLLKKPQTRNDAVVQIDQLGFGQFVDVDGHGVGPLGAGTVCRKWLMKILALRVNVEVRGSRSAKHGGNQQAQLVGCPTRLQG